MKKQTTDYPLVVIAEVDGILAIALSIIDVTESTSQLQIAKELQTLSVFPLITSMFFKLLHLTTLNK